MIWQLYKWLTGDRSAIDLVYGILSVLGYDIVCLWEKGHKSNSLALEPSHTWNISGLFGLSGKVSFIAKAKCYPQFTCMVIWTTMLMSIWPGESILYFGFHEFSTLFQWIWNSRNMYDSLGSWRVKHFVKINRLLSASGLCCLSRPVIVCLQGSYWLFGQKIFDPRIEEGQLCHWDFSLGLSGLSDL